jgi:putative transposase
MARLPRLIIPSQPHHVVQGGSNGQPIFVDEADYLTFLTWLRAGAKQFKVAVHAYVLMPHQLQLLVTPADENGLGQMMQWIGRYYVPYFNQKYGRSGTLWQGRYKTSPIDPPNYLLQCSLYIELAPLRAGLAEKAVDYIWSSFCHHAGVRPDGVIVDHALFWALGNTPFDREAHYLALAEAGLSSQQLKVIEQAVLKGWPLGSEQFKQALQNKMKRQVLPAKRGRPFKVAPEAL